MRDIPTSCAYCRAPIAVGFWQFYPRKPPVEIACPTCGARNNINAVSILSAATSQIAFGIFAGWSMQTALPSNQPVVFLLLGFLIAIWPATFVGSRRPGLVKSRWRPAHLTDEERAAMNALGIVHNDEYFVVGDMHFDHLHDAIAHARASRSR